MKIVFVADHCCIRLFKESSVLLDRGHEMHLVSFERGTGHNFYKSFLGYWYFKDKNTLKIQHKNQFQEAIRHYCEYIKPDLFVCHNEPDWICEETIKVAHPLGIPVVWDIHDIESARQGQIPLEEQRIMQMIDGIVHVSEYAKKWTNWVHSYLKCPQEVIYSMYPSPEGIKNREDIRKVLPVPSVYPLVAPKIHNSLVYEGGIGAPEEKQEMIKSGNAKVLSFNMRNYAGIFEQFSNEGFKPFIYGAGAPIGECNKDAMKYMKYGCVTQPSIDPLNLIYELAKYEFGFVGFPVMGTPLFDMAFPNKFCDYMMAGVIPIVVNCKQTGELVADNKLGFYFPDLKMIKEPDVLRKILNCNRSEYQARIVEWRKTLYMENQIERLEKLYTDAIAYAKTKLEKEAT